MNKVLSICQARYDSTRLPGKVMLKILGKPLLWYVIKRLKLVKTPNEVIIATSEYPSNEPIMKLAKKMGVKYIAGSEKDVLDRFYQAAKEVKGDIIIRTTSDCPLIDPNIIERGLDLFINNDYDYVSNVHPPTYPDGFDVEIFSFKALKKAWENADLKSEREHVTPYIWKNEELFKLKNFEYKNDLSSFRLTVDTQEDFTLVSKVIKEFYDKWDSFTLNDVIEFLKDNPKLLEINSQYKRNEGYIKSLRNEKN